MSGLVGLLALVAGIALVVGAADVFVDGLLGVGRRLGIAPFVLGVALSGFETENLAAGIAINAKGLPEAAAGTFLGGVTFLALGVAGLGGLIAPMQVPRRFAAWTALAPVPLLVFAIDGNLSRVEGAGLLVWFAVALTGAARSGRRLLAAEGDDDRVAVPARRGRPELALGNIAGTTIHFSSFNAGLVALVKPLALGRATTHLYLPAAVAGPAILAAVLLVRRRLGRLEGAGLLALYLAYVAAAIWLAP